MSNEPKQIMNTLELVEYLGISKRFVEKLRTSGKGPVYMQIGRSVRYTKVDVDNWLKLKRVVQRASSEEEA